MNDYERFRNKVYGDMSKVNPYDLKLIKMFLTGKLKSKSREFKYLKRNKYITSDEGRNILTLKGRNALEHYG